MARKPKARGSKKPARKKARKGWVPRKSPPPAAIRAVSRIIHGQMLTDDYGWLRDANWRDVVREPAKLDKAIRRYLETENDYTAAAFRKTSKLQKLLKQEMRGRIKEDDSSVPSRDGDYAYFARYRKGGQHPLICRIASA
ncbi:MAG TPA: hypothetical protein VHD34_06730, partial [Xanthobacteraceae bacterium]|nr:hypothetical protein [Xanthobacteraceae bacterium]